MRTVRWKYGVTAPGIGGRRQPAADHYREQYLYDLLADRYELNNLAGSTAHAEVARRLRRRLLRHLRAVERAEPAIEPAGARRGGGIRVGDEELAGLEQPGGVPLLRCPSLVAPCRPGASQLSVRRRVPPRAAGRGSSPVSSRTPAGSGG